MNQAAKQITRIGRYIQTTGRVIRDGKEDMRVETEEGEFSVRRAVSCLVEPVRDDRVFIAGDLAEGLYVIAVLEREVDSPLHMALEGDVSLGIRKGRFSVAAEGIDLVSARDMGLTSPELTVRSRKGTIFIDQLTCIGRDLLAHMEGIRCVGRFLDGIWDRLSQKAKRSYRIVEEIDQVRSGQIDYRAEKNLNIRGRNARIGARDLVKVDGDQIHLG